jgi:hypothetical protein
MKTFDDLVAEHKRSILASDDDANKEARLIFLRLMYSNLKREITSPRLDIAFDRDGQRVVISHRAFDRELVVATFDRAVDGDHLVFQHGREDASIAAVSTDWAINSRKVTPGQLSQLGMDRPLFREIIEGVVREVAAAELNAD